VPNEKPKPGDSLYSILWNNIDGYSLKAHVIKSVGRVFLYLEGSRDKVEIATLDGERLPNGNYNTYYATREQAEKIVECTQERRKCNSLIRRLFKEDQIVHRKQDVNELRALNVALEKFIGVDTQ
jgi:hypothetical protein